MNDHRHRAPLGEIDSNTQLPSKELNGKKRGYSAMMSPQGAPGDNFNSGLEAVRDEESEDDLEGAIIDKNCDQIRRTIRALIDSGEMKVGEFQKAISVSSRSYLDFLGQSGSLKGSGSSTYHNAWSFFKKREMKGIPMPSKKRKTTTDSSGSKKVAAQHTDISEIFLPGEQDDTVQIYDTCDEIRKKIAAYMRKDGITQASLLRELQAQFHTSRAPSRMQSSQLTAFRSKKGPSMGNTSSIFYSAYVFFEKLRIKENKPKSKHRLDMENAWPHGFDTQIGGHRGFWCGPNSRPFVNNLGQVSIEPVGGRPR